MLELIKKLARNRYRQVTLLVLLILVSNILEGFGISLVLPVFQRLLHQDAASGLSAYVDRTIQFLGLEPSLLNALILLNIAFVTKTVLALVAKYYSTGIAADYLCSIQSDLYSELLEAKLSFFQHEKQGTLINGLTTEIQRTSNTFVQVATWISSLGTAVLYLAVAMKISFKLAILSWVLGFVMIMPIRMINRKAWSLGTEWTRLNEAIQTYLGETFSGIKYIKAGANQKGIIQTFLSLVLEFADNWRMIAFLSNTSSIFAQPISVFILSILLFMSVSFNISLPELFVFLLALLRLLPTVTGMAALRTDINANVSSLEKIETLKALAKSEQEVSGSGKAPVYGREIEIRNISFSHGNTPVLKQLSFKLDFGQVLAITGSSGSGKTTLVDLIVGLYRPSEGQILIDGSDLSSIHLNEWRKQIAYVSQDPFLFHDTIRNNIVASRPEVTDEEIVHAARLAHAHDFITSMEKGYDTVVGDRGSKISGGQKQRIALARALLRLPRLLILDEATSALDHESEKLIRQSIHELKTSRSLTMIIIAHRKETIEEADNSLTIQKL